MSTSWFPVSVLLLCLLAAAPLRAEQAGCGSVIVPTGVGMGPPAGVNSLNPLLTTSAYSHEVIEQFLRPLVWIDRHGQPDFDRSVAASVDTPDDGSTFLVTLHNWRWSDGVPITADDLLFTLDLIRSMGPAYAWYGLGGVPTLIASSRVVSAHQLELRMVRKVNPRWFVSLGLGNLLYPLPRHVFAGMSPVELRRRQNDAALFAVGDGPFVLQEYAVGRHAVLVPNPLYGGHHPQVRRLVIAFPTGNTALEQMRAGALDMASIPYLLTRFATRLPGFGVVRPTPIFAYGDGYINFRSGTAPFLADDAVRRAITRGIDQQEIVDLIYRGQASVDHGPVPPSMVDLQSDAARAGYPDLSFDPAAAGALLAKDGWSPGPDGILLRNGQRLAFSILTSSESADGIIQAQLIQRNLRRIGMEVSIRTIGFNQLLAILDGNGHDWDVVTIRWSITTYPNMHDFFSSDGALNNGHFVDPRMDALNRDVMFGSGDGPLRAVQDYTAERAPHLYLPSGTPEVLVRPGIGHVSDFLSPNGMWSAELLTLSGPLACGAGAGGGDAAHP